MKCGKCGRRLWGRPNTYVHKRKGLCHRICPKRKRPRGEKKPARTHIKGVDLVATAARRFKHPKSRVMLDGREILHGLDYKLRVRQVEYLDGHICQWPIVKFKGADVVYVRQNDICGAPSNGRPHHRVKRSKLRDDRASNLMAICDEHHKIAHPEFQTRF